MKRISIFSFLIGTMLLAGPALADDPWLGWLSQAELDQKAHAVCVEKSPLGNGSPACAQSIQNCINAYRQHVYSACDNPKDSYGDDFYSCRQSFLDGAANVARTHHGSIGLNCSLISQTWPTACGNGTKDAGEACDDGNQVDTDSCSNTCKAKINFILPIHAADPVSINIPMDEGAGHPSGEQAPEPQAQGDQTSPGDDPSISADAQGVPALTTAETFSGGGCTLGLSAPSSFGSAWVGILSLILPGVVHWLRRK